VDFRRIGELLAKIAADAEVMSLNDFVKKWSWMPFGIWDKHNKDWDHDRQIFEENYMRQKSPINKLQQLMVITMEECGELTQVCSKVLRRNSELTDVNKDDILKIIEEAGDVYCMLELMVEHGLITWDDLIERADVKRTKLVKWSDLIEEVCSSKHRGHIQTSVRDSDGSTTGRKS
jgi:hypothetical protein